MPIRLDAIYVAPVKSLALQRVERARIGARGIAGDRAFFVMSDRDRMVSQREYPSLVQVKSTYDPESDALSLTFPDGSAVSGTPTDSTVINARFFGQRDVEGIVVEGGWSEALSRFCGAPMRLVRARGNSFDALPISMCSSASIDALRASSGESSIDERRFRPNLYLGGVTEAHGEDGWIGHNVAIGTDAVIHVVLRDERCSMTTRDPDTGARDFNTLGMIAAYRPDETKQVNFGVYGSVIAGGDIYVGDEVIPHTQTAPREPGAGE